MSGDIKGRSQNGGVEGQNTDVSENFSLLLGQMGVGALFDRLAQIPKSDRETAVRICMAVLSIVDEVGGRDCSDGPRGNTNATSHRDYESAKDTGYSSPDVSAGDMNSADRATMSRRPEIQRAMDRLVAAERFGRDIAAGKIRRDTLSF